MKQNKEEQIGLNLRPDDITTIMEIAEEDRRPRAQVLRNLLEDIVSGALPLDLSGELKVKRTTTIVRVESAFKAKFEAFKEVTNLSADKIVEQALKVIREQRANRPEKA